MISMPPISKRNLGLVTFAVIIGYGLTEATLPLSAPRLAGIAAAILEIFQFEPIVAPEEPNFFRQGLRSGQVGEKSPGAGSGFFFLAHGCPSERLALGVNLSRGVGDDVQFHAIVQLFLCGVRSFFHGLQGAQPNIARAILHPDKTFPEFFRFNHGSLLKIGRFLIIHEHFMKMRRRGVPPPRYRWGKVFPVLPHYVITGYETSVK
jgi:hypothetical protein